jgi:D-xylose transport system substrate-binding protein
MNVCVFKAQAASTVKIGFVLSTLQEERYQKDEKYFIAEAKKLGLIPIVLSADNNPQTQRAKVENLLSQGVKALVIQPVNSNSAASLVKLAHEDNVPVISYDRLIEKAPVDFYLTVNSFEIGRLQAQAAVDATHGQGNYVLLMGQAGQSVVADIVKGWHSVLDKYPKIKVVVEQNHEGWSPQLAMTTTENALTKYKNKVDAVLGMNSGMASGAVQALVAQGLAGKVFVAGSDADLAAIKNIVAGRQQFEIVMDIKSLAETAAEVAGQLAHGQKPPYDELTKNGDSEVPTRSMGVYAVTKNNLDERIFKPGFHTRSAVGLAASAP